MKHFSFKVEKVFTLWEEIIYNMDKEMR